MTEPKKVILPISTLIAAVSTGVARQVENVCLTDRKNQNGATFDAFQGFGGHIRGALGEWAVARYLNLFPTGTFGMDEPDVGNCVEARAASRDGYAIRLKRDDLPESIFVLAVPQQDLVTTHLIGWCYGEEAKIEEYWQNTDGGKFAPRPNYYAPQKILHPMEDLKEMFRGRKPLSKDEYLASKADSAKELADV